MNIQYGLIETIEAVLISIGLEKEYKDDIDDIARGVISELNKKKFRDAGDVVKIPKSNK